MNQDVVLNKWICFVSLKSQERGSMTQISFSKVVHVFSYYYFTLQIAVFAPKIIVPDPSLEVYPYKDARDRYKKAPQVLNLS